MKTARIAVIVLCMALLVLPSAGMPLFGPRDSGAEYRVPADYPSIADESGRLNEAFSGEFESWLCDHFGFRSAIIHANAWLNYRLLHASANEQVVVGRGDWLFFSPTVPDYTGEGRLTQAELDAIASNLRAFSEAYERRGARVYLAIIPNKSTLYPDFMPGRYPRRTDEGNIPLVRAACAALPLTWIDLSAPLGEAAAGERLIYYKTDTHWNALGAAIAARTILQAMETDARDYGVEGDVSFSDGDLARLMGLSGAIVESVPSVVPDAPLPDANYAGRAFTLSGNGKGRLTVFRDSFGTAIGPWLTDAYGQCEMVWTSPIESGHAADDVLVLICERNIREYLLTEPDLEAEEAAGSEGDGDAAARGAFKRDDYEEAEAEDGDDFFDDGDGEDGDDFFDDGEDDEGDFPGAEDDGSDEDGGAFDAFDDFDDFDEDVETASGRLTYGI